MYKRVLLVSLLAVVPTSSNYTLKSFDFTAGGNHSSSSYQLKSAVGTGGQSSSTSYVLPAGIKAAMTLSAPAAPTFTNVGSSYSQLKITLNTSGFAADTKYLIAVSSDNWVTTRYVQPDQTIGSSLSIANYQTYAAWGGASGFSLLGLNSGATYKVKVAALQGSATGSPFGPEASASTVSPTVTFAVNTSLTSSPPFATSFASLPAGSVVTGDATVTATVTTNAQYGGSLLLKGQNNGLTSSARAYTVNSANADLDSAGRGYGARLTSTTQSGGGPLLAISPYNGTGNTVGNVSTSLQELANFTSPITSGAATFQLKAKTDYTVPAANDYGDILTVTLALTF
jgi:hypothetical protein